MRLRVFSILAVVAATPAVAAFAQSGVDVIKLRNGDERKGKILNVTWQGVEFTPQGAGAGGGGRQSEALDTVGDIVFYDLPFALSKAESELKAGNAVAAVQQFQRAIEDVDGGKARGVHKQYALFGIGRAHQQNSDWAEAIKAYERLLDSVKDTRFRREAYENAVVCAERARDGAAVDRLLGKMRSEPGELGKSLAAKAELTSAAGLLRGGKFGEARAGFEKLARGSNDPAIQAEAQVGVIRCLSAEKKLDDLKRACDTAIRGAATSSILLGAAYTAMGDMVFDRAMEGGGKDPAAFKEALMHYLHTVVLYAPGRGEPTDDHEKALYRAGKCFEKLRDALQKPETKKEYTERAFALYEEVVRDYKGSEWAQKAERDMAALRR